MGTASRISLAALAVLAALAGACGDDGKHWSCVIATDSAEYSQQIGCYDDYLKLAAAPTTESLSGARSTKTVIDTADGDALYFQNSEMYPIHYDFASTHLSGNGLPYITSLSEFNATEYYSPQRRFLLGALSYYEEPDVWAYEISPYDNATADMIAKAYRIIRKNVYVGGRLYFHPTSEAVATEAEELPKSVPVITTDELYDGIDYQPLNLGTAMGQLRFYRAADLGSSYLSFRDIAVLDEAPNDISACSGVITEEFQTPLSHVNVLSQNRGTPNMGLKGAFEREDLRALEGKWVEFTVGAYDWSVVEVTQEQADAW